MSKKYKKKSYKLANVIIKAIFALSALITAVAKLIATLAGILQQKPAGVEGQGESPIHTYILS